MEDRGIVRNFLLLDSRERVRSEVCILSGETVSLIVIALHGTSTKGACRKRARYDLWCAEISMKKALKLIVSVGEGLVECCAVSGWHQIP